MWQAPNYEWLDARSLVTKGFTAFVSQVMAGFQGMQDVQASSGEVEVVGTGEGRRFQVTI